MNHSTYTARIFIIVLLMGVAGITGVLLLKFNIDRLTSNYETFIEESYETGKDMDTISKNLYRHQTLVLNYLRTADEDQKDIYAYEEVIARENLRKSSKEFETHINTDAERGIYNTVRVAVDNYLEEVNEIFDYVKTHDEEDIESNSFERMGVYLAEVNETFDQFSTLMNNNLAEGRRRMNNDILISRISAILCTALILVAVLVGLFFCVKQTAGLENYKISLEKEIVQKNQELMAHNERLLEIQNNTVIGMATLIESRDLETGGHIKRTSAYVELLAKEAQKRGVYAETLTDSYIELLVKAAPMHDIGKIIVPDQILQKPGKLTKEEFEVMKRHAAEGGRIVREVLSGVEDKAYIDIAFDVSTYHHEWWNGNGYPAGKKQNDIPLSARIMAVADVFDALISKRCYKDAFPVDASLKIIKEEAGTHFDPRLTEIFIDMHEEIEKIIQKENDR